MKNIPFFFQILPSCGGLDLRNRKIYSLTKVAKLVSIGMCKYCSALVNRRSNQKGIVLLPHLSLSRLLGLDLRIGKTATLDQVVSDETYLGSCKSKYKLFILIRTTNNQIGREDITNLAEMKYLLIGTFEGPTLAIKGVKYSNWKS